MAQGKPKRYSDEHLKLLEAGVVVYPGDESFIENMRAKGVWQGGPTVTWDEFWEVSDQDVVDPAANQRDKRPRLEGDPFSQPLSIEERRMVDPTHAYPGHVRLGAPGPVTPGDPRPIEPTVTETITQVDDDTVPDKRVIKKDYKPNFERFAPGQDLGMVDPSQAYPGSVRRGAPGPVTPGRQFPTEGEDGGILNSISEFGGALNLPSAKDIWEFGGAVGAPSASDIVGGVGDFLGLGQNTALAGAPPPDQYPVPTGQDDPVGEEQTQLDIIRANNAQQEANARAGISNLSPELQGALSSGVGVGDAFIADQQKKQQADGGLVEQALQQADAGADVEEVLGDEGAGLLSFPSDAEEMGVATPDTRVPPQLEKAVEKPKEDASTVGGSEVLDPVVKAELEREWGKWTYKPRERREKFMSQLNRIYMKAAWLDAIAAITGGQSRSPQYIERAVGKLETMTKFDQEERVYGIWRDVYYDENGNYDPPRSKKQAAERARKLGASPQETKAIYGWAEEGEDLQQWYRRVDGKLEVTTTEGKKTRPKQGDTDVDWIMGTPSDRAPAARTWTNWTDGKMTIYLPAGTSPADKGLVGMDWRKGSATESSGWSPTWKKEIGMLEKIAITDREEAVSQAISALRDEKYSHLYEGQEDRREAAEHWIDEILANYAARGNIGIMEAETAEPAAAGPAKEYATLAEAEAAAQAGTLHKKDRVIIGGVSGRWE